MKIIHTYRTYDRTDCTSTGHMLELRGDGSVRITEHSCWKGSRSGRVTLTPAGAVTIPDKAGEDTPDLDAVLSQWWESEGGEPAGRLLRTGYTVR